MTLSLIKLKYAGKGVNMKLLFAVIISTLSLGALACPNLSGSYYKCTTGDRIQDVAMGINKAKLDITQSGQNFSVDFLGKKMNLKVGETVNLTNYSQQQRATIYSQVYSFCQSTILSLEEQSKIVYDNGNVENEKSETDVYMNGGKIQMDILQHRANGRDVKLNIKCRKR